MTESGEFVHVFVAVYKEIVGVYSRSERGERSMKLRNSVSALESVAVAVNVGAAEEEEAEEEAEDEEAEKEATVLGKPWKETGREESERAAEVSIFEVSSKFSKKSKLSSSTTRQSTPDDVDLGEWLPSDMFSSSLWEQAYTAASWEWILAVYACVIVLAVAS
jgi:hypothetical protein